MPVSGHQGPAPGTLGPSCPSPNPTRMLPSRQCVTWPLGKVQQRAGPLLERASIRSSHMGTRGEGSVTSTSEFRTASRWKVLSRSSKRSRFPNGSPETTTKDPPRSIHDYNHPYLRLLPLAREAESPCALRMRSIQASCSHSVGLLGANQRVRAAADEPPGETGQVWGDHGRELKPAGSATGASPRHLRGPLSRRWTLAL